MKRTPTRGKVLTEAQDKQMSDNKIFGGFLPTDSDLGYTTVITQLSSPMNRRRHTNNQRIQPIQTLFGAFTKCHKQFLFIYF